VSRIANNNKSSADTSPRQGSAEEKAVVNLKAGESVDVYVEYDNLSPAPKGVQMQPALMRGVVGQNNTYGSIF
jgi:hypothetical protein